MYFLLLASHMCLKQHLSFQITTARAFRTNSHNWPFPLLSDTSILFETTFVSFPKFRHSAIPQDFRLQEPPSAHGNSPQSEGIKGNHLVVGKSRSTQKTGCSFCRSLNQGFQDGFLSSYIGKKAECFVHICLISIIKIHK